MNAMAASDIVVYDRNHQILLLVEVKATQQTTQEWAVAVREHASRRSRGFVPRYFMVVARDFIYCWGNAAATHRPEVVAETDQLIGAYLRDAGLSTAEVPGSALELAVGIWLLDLTSDNERTPAAAAELNELRDAVRDGSIEFSVAA